MTYSKEERRAYQNAYREKRRVAAKEYLGNKCASCGSVSNLEFDHIDPLTKIKAISHLLDAKKEVFWAEVDKCQLLCEDCHTNKTIANGIKPPPVAVGEDHPTSKLKNDEVLAIRADYSTGKYTFRSLGRKYNVSHGTISAIVQNRTWRHI